MKASLALVLVLVLILGITIPHGVTAAAIPASSLPDKIKIIVGKFKPILEEAASKFKQQIDELSASISKKI